MSRKNRNKFQPQAYTAKEEQGQIREPMQEKDFDESSSDELAEDPTELRVGELVLDEPLPPGKIEAMPERIVGAPASLGMGYEEWGYMNKLFTEIDLLERGKIGTWQAAFEIVREIRKLRA